MGSTVPRKVISPSWHLGQVGMPVRAETSAVAMVIPARVRPGDRPLGHVDVDVDVLVEHLSRPHASAVLAA